MSRRPSRRQERRFRGRGYDLPAHALDPFAALDRTPVGLGSRPDATTTMEQRVLALLTSEGDVWTGDDTVGGFYTSRIASSLGIRARSSERDRLTDTLTSMRRRGLLHYEFRRGMDREIRWWATEQGRAAAG